MKISHINQSDINGGAARAAYRIHQALLKENYDSRMLVDVAVSGDWSVETPGSKRQRFASKAKSVIGSLIARLLKTENKNLHSVAVLDSPWPERLNKSDADIVQLHWVAGDMLSIADIGRIKKPIVWTLHDMWAFCGAEHYTSDFRWQTSYNRNNRPHHEGGLDINRWTWSRKQKLWKTPIHIVGPSKWLADAAADSVLMRHWPVSVVPYFIDTDVWRPVDRFVARDLLGLPQDVPIAVFGALGGVADTRKGFDLLKEALDHLRGEVPGLNLLIFGQRPPKSPLDLGFPVHYTGHLHDDISMSLVYSAADLFVLPSRMDNLPNTGLEAHACGIPVVGFNVGGIPDIIEDRKTGYVATPFDTSDLAAGIKWTLSDSARLNGLKTASRARACSNWNSDVVAAGYVKVYEKVLKDW